MKAAILILGLALACGCASAPSSSPRKTLKPGESFTIPPRREAAVSPAWVIYPADGEAVRMEEWVREHPMPPGQEVALHDLSRSETSSTHIVQIRQAEAMHMHERHDLVAVLQKGRGVLRVASRELRLSPGSVVVIPRGTPHSFVNQSPEPVAVFVVFSPPFDGEDTVPIAE